MNGKIIALDFGLKRTGVAITDDLCIIASPLETIETASLSTYLSGIVAKERVHTIVIGEPKRLDGRDAHVTQNVYFLKEALQKQFPELKICLYDERFTSKMASQAILMSGLKKGKRKDKGLTDKVSAAIILQSYLRQID
jgi:putative Holliday junction resolvase